MLINKFILIPSLVVVSGGVLFAGSALAVTDTTNATATVAAVLSIDSPTAASFGTITPPKATATTAADIVVKVISNTTYTLAGTLTSGLDISLKKGAGAVPDGAAFATDPAFASAYVALTGSAQIFATSTGGLSLEAGDDFSVSLQLPTFPWRAAAGSATVSVVTFTALAT